MTAFYQSFDGGPAGAGVEWDDSSQLGSAVYQSGDGTVTYTTASPIRGATSARCVTTAAQRTACIVQALDAGVKKLRGHAYVRVPAAPPEGSTVQVVNVQTSGGAQHVVFRPDGSITLESWGTLIGKAAPAGTLAPNMVVRVSVSVEAGGTSSAAVYAGDSTTALWSTSGPSIIAADATLAEFHAGIIYVDPTAAVDLTIDDVRVESGVSSPLLSPEGGGTAPKTPPAAVSRAWVRDPVGWRRLGTADAVQERFVPLAPVGAVAPGGQTYPVPSGAVFVAPSGSDQSGTGSVSAPFGTLGRALVGVQAGGTIVLRAGNHHAGVAIPAKATSYSIDTLWAGLTGNVANVTIQGYPGESAWLDGSSTVTGWAKSGSVWEAPVSLTMDRSPTGTSGADDNADPNWAYVNTARPLAHWPERVWIDDVEQRQVASKAEVVPGTFYVTGTASGKLFTSSKYTLGTDPTGKTVRVADLATCMSSPGTGFTLRGVGVRRYAGSVPHRGVLKVRHSGARLENVTIQDASAVGLTLFQAHNTVITGCTFRRVGMLGVDWTETDDATITNVAVTDCNRQGFNVAPESGGIKITHSRRPTVTRATVWDCACTGIWLDESVANAVIASNDVHWCDGHGIVSELCGGTTIANNVVTAPGLNACTIFNTSGTVRVWCNTFSRPGRLADYGRAVTILGDDRAPLKAGSVGLDPRFGFPHPDGVDGLTVNVTIANNIIGPSTAQALLAVEDYQKNAGKARDWSKYGLVADGNQYVIRAGKPDWKWIFANAGSADPTILWTLPDLTARGLDKTSTTLTGDYGSDIAGARTIRAAAERPQGRALPADVAALVGATSGATNVVGAVR